MERLRRIRDYLYLLWIARKVAEFQGRGGRIVVITGSYGKTSVRELTCDLLRQKYQIVSTSRNYNTAVGIAKTLYWELDELTEWLVIEVGAYRVGEIWEFCQALKPDVGVITGIARQHLSLFGSFEKIIQAKTEIARYIKEYGGVLVGNGSDATVKREVKDAIWYEGTGRVEINQNGAIAIAKVCGMSEAEIASAKARWRPVPSRFELTEDRYGMKVIDDSYNSNEKSFVEAVEYLGKQKKYTRVLVTPGLVELGSETEEIHRQLGAEIPGKADIVILVGKNERTKALELGMGGKMKLIYVAKTLDFIHVVKELKLKKEPLVLLENDIPENY